MSSRSLFVGAVLVLLALLIGCGGGGKAPNTPDGDKGGSTEATPNAPTSGKKLLNLATVGDLQTLDVGKMSGSPEGKVAYNLFEGLWMPAQETAPPVYGAAESHKVSEDQKTWTITLRAGAKWSNGDPLTAQDFVYAWKRVMTPGFEADYAEFMDFIENGRAFRKGEVSDFAQVGVKALDERTLEVKLTNPTPFFAELLAFYTFFPVHQKSVEQHGAQWTRPGNLISNGPYTLTDYRHQQDLTLTRNEHYWDKANVKIDEVKVHIIKDNTALLNAFTEGRVDVFEGNIPIARVPAFKGKPEYRADPLLGTYYYRINTEANPALGNVKVRQALSLAIDRQSLADLTMKGLYAPANSFVPPMPGYTPATTLPYDPKKARELLTEAGFPNGQGFPEVSLLFNTDENHKLVAEIVQDTWKRELNITVKLENKEWKTYLDDVDKHSYQIARAGWIGDYNDPTTFLGIFTTGNGNNDTGFGLPEYDEKIKQAYASTNAEERTKLLMDAEKLLMEQAPIIPIYYYKNPYLISPKVLGWKAQNRDTHLVKYLDLK